MTATPRQRIGSYELLVELASGGVGTVDIALQRGAAGFERLVVVKRVHRFLLKNKDSYAMFRDEARLASSIRHPNVVPVVDVVELDGELLLVMDYVEGVSLSTLRKAYTDAGSSLPAPIASRILSDVLSGLHGAHEAADLRGKKLEIVHRDVSPQNVLVGIDGVARVIDFGIAKAVGRLTETQSGLIKGKFAYMSPEQVESTDLDRRSDVFSAAVVLHEALTGQRLFQAESDIATLRKVVKGEIPDPSSLVSGVPPAIDAALRIALARDREQRFATALAFQSALESAAPPAPWRDVAEAVLRMCGVELEGRQAQLATALGADAQRVTALPPSEPASVRVLAPTEGDTRVAATADVARALRPRSTAWVIVPLAVATLGAGLFLAWPRGGTAVRTTPPPEVPPAPPPSAMALASTTTTSDPPPIPTASPPDAAPPPSPDRTGRTRGPKTPPPPGGTKPGGNGDDLRHDFDAGRPF